MRIAICGGVVAFNVRCLSRFILLRGPRAVRALEWTANGEYTAYLGPLRTAVGAEIALGSFRLISWLLVLRLRTDRGNFQVLVDGRRQRVTEFRRLCRALNTRPRSASRGLHELS